MDRSSNFQNQQTKPLEVSTKPGKTGILHRRVCPLASSPTGTPAQWQLETKILLRTRLRVAVVFLFLGFLAFFIRDKVLGVEAEANADLVNAVHLGVIAAMGAFTALLWSRWCASILQLRMIELGIFGVPALFFAWMNFRAACWCSLHAQDGYIDAYFAKTSIVWVLLINLYGLFIPNSWKRAALVTGVFVLIPVSVTLFTALEHPEMRDEFAFEGGFSSLLLFLMISYFAAVYGAHKIGSLRREAVAARQIGAYELKRLLGKGGMGEVHLAEHKFLKRPCAIKLIRPESAGDPHAVARFESEVQATAQLTHWNTVEIYDYGHTDDGTFYYAMEYLPGLNLQDLVDQYGPLPPGRAVYLLRQVCGALREAHAHELIHRDIKPGNIFSAQRGGYFDVAKLLDFGLVKSTGAKKESLKLTMEGMVIGSPLYTAPEIVDGEVKATPSTDIYSLGAVAYFLVTGKPVFDFETPLKVVFAHVNQEVVPPSQIMPTLPADLEEVILRCLQKQPSNRYRDVEELERALSHCDCVDEWSSEQAEHWWQGRDEQSEPVTSLLTSTINASTTILPLNR